jgi:serine/threonine-protein kinase
MGSFTPPADRDFRTQLSPGDRLDRYELLCVLAQGGMGTVWLARMSGKLGFERLVALKTILPTYSSDRQFSDMFLDEARIAAQIDQENVARILEIGEDRGTLYYAMEFIDGESVRKLYRDVRAAEQAFPLGVALRIIADACAGLHATHELRSDDGALLEVVHRDVSPQNLLVSVRGTTKLIDFGVAKANARRSEETAAGTLKGKIEYMAPEQARGITLDRRADVYALGAVLFELIGGRPVRDTDDGKQLAALHDLMTGVPYVPLPVEVPEIVRGIVDRALAREPRARFPTADALRLAIEQAILATGLVATHDEVASVLARFSRERTAKRKDVIERAIRAATDGRLDAATVVAPASAVYPAAGADPAAAAAHPAGPTPYPPPATSRSFVTPPTGSSMPTGATPMTASVAPSPRASVGKVLSAIGFVVLVAVAGVVLGVMLTRRSERARNAAVAAASQPTVVMTAVPVPADPAAASASAPVAAEPSASASAETALTSAVASARPGKDGGAKRPTKGSGGKAVVKRGDGDEYGF